MRRHSDVALQAEEFLSTRQVHEQYGPAESTLRYWRHIGEGGPASFRIGRRVVYRRSECDRWIKQQEAATTRGGSGAA